MNISEANKKDYIIFWQSLFRILVAPPLSNVWHWGGRYGQYYCGINLPQNKMPRNGKLSRGNNLWLYYFSLTQMLSPCVCRSRMYIFKWVGNWFIEIDGSEFHFDKFILYFDFQTLRDFWSSIFILIMNFISFNCLKIFTIILTIIQNKCSTSAVQSKTKHRDWCWILFNETQNKM